MKKKYPMDLSGERFGRLTVIRESDKKIKDKNARYYVCVCDCGNVTDTGRFHLINGAAISCGCFRKEYMHNKEYKHGGGGERIYSIWCSMRHRCYSVKHPSYERYGLKGITVCEEWRNGINGYKKFKKWALENKYDDKLTLDRIDFKGNYEPNNCRWATPLEQSNNTKRNIKVTIDNITYSSISALARYYGISDSAIRYRYNKGLRGEDLISPKRSKDNKFINDKKKEELEQERLNHKMRAKKEQSEKIIVDLINDIKNTLSVIEKEIISDLIISENNLKMNSRKIHKEIRNLNDVNSMMKNLI